MSAESNLSLPPTGPAREESAPHIVPTAAGAPAIEPPLDALLPSSFTPYRRPHIVAPAPGWVGPLFLTLALLMVPWTVSLAFQLDAEERVTWVGFDLALLAALATTGWLSLRRSTWIEEAAAVAATLLVVDSWFDVTTSQGWQRDGALLAAVLVELPLAALCFWIARHAAAVGERSTQFLHERSQRQAMKLHEQKGRLRRIGSERSSVKD